MFPGVHYHSPDQPVSSSAAIFLSSIIREIPQDYNNYFILSVRKTVFMCTRRKTLFQEVREYLTAFDVTYLSSIWPFDFDPELRKEMLVS